MNTRRLLAINIVFIILVIVACFVGYYFYNQSTLYLSTDDAQVTGKQIVVAAPAAGKVANWTGSMGTSFQTGDKVGEVQVMSGTATNAIPIAMPQNGTIVQNNAVENEYAGPGTPLAYAYDLNNLYVTAMVKETNINQVKVGQSVDVYVDAYPGISIKGTVSAIGLATASTFSLLPTQSTTADYTKVTQVIPVKITLTGYEGIGLAPGMSATVRIHK